MAFILMTQWGQGYTCKSEIRDKSQQPQLTEFVRDFHANALPLDQVLEVDGRDPMTGERDPLRLRVMDIRDIWIEG